jgi:hypothetical protein
LFLNPFVLQERGLKLKTKTLLSSLFPAFLLLGTVGSSLLWADPSDNVTADQPLYQRVKKLEDYGLLDPQDKAVLDQGLVVNRLELAFYVEKAKARMDAPELPTAVPTPEQPTAVPTLALPTLETPALPNPVVPAPAMPAPIAVPPPMEAPLLPLPVAPGMDRDALRKEIDDLLKELHQESEVLRTRAGLDDYRIQQDQAELDKLKDVQDEVDSTFKKANKSGGVPHFSTISDIRVENVNVSGLTQVSATSVKDEVNLGAWSDLGGKGSISLGLGSYVYSSASDTPSAPASIYLFSPQIHWGMDGKLGHWDDTFAVEVYTADVDLGDFTRGVPLSNLRYEEPFEIKRYSTDKNMKNWDDYMTNLGYVPSYTSWVGQASTGIVFDGFYMVGSNLPLVSKDAKATVLIGRMGRTADVPDDDVPENHRLEEGLKYSQPWAGGFLGTVFSAYWINENLGITPANTPAMDSQNYEADLAFNISPFFLSLKGGYSQFYTGIETAGAYSNIAPNVDLADPAPLRGPAGQASLTYYPFTLYYTAISDSYSDIQSTAYTAGFNLNKYGYAYTGDDWYYGYVGMVNDLISDRHGWRANLGWQGRQQDWMKGWPSILDDVVINFDVASNTEYSVIPDEVGHNVIETYQLITVFYPDDTGMWGGSVWGGYGGIHPMGQAYENNIAGIRNDGNGTTNEMYLTSLGIDYMQRIPFILPTANEPVQDINGKAVTVSSGTNTYTNLDNLKTFNYITLTTKLQLNKMLGMPQPFYGSFFFTDHQISGTTTNPALVNMPDPNRPGQTLANIPDMFNQQVYDCAALCQVAKNLNVMADYGWETWTSNYTYPIVNFRTDAVGAGFAYDLPWGGGKFEFRFKHLNYQDFSVVANSYQANQIYSYLLFQF